VAIQVLENIRIFAGGADFTGVSNAVSLEAEHEAKDITTFNSVDAGGKLWKEVKAGLAQSKLSGGGFWEAGDTSKVDDTLWAAIGGAGPWTIGSAASANVGSLAYIINGMHSKYTLFDQVGEVAPWKAEVAGTWPSPRGVFLHPPGTARTVTGDGTAVEHVAVSASQHVYASLHVLSVSGTDTPTITVVVESDVDDQFDGSETSQISFTAATARGGQVLRTAGAITDTFYRATWTISGTDPSFLFVVALGVK
jgi:hypothetical protein